METRFLTSRQNQTVKKISSYSDRKSREKDNVFVAEGYTIVTEALEKGFVPAEIVVRDDVPAQKRQKLLSLLEKVGKSELNVAPDFVFEKMTTEKSSDGFLAVFDKSVLPEKEEYEKSDYFIALERVQDPGNVGTVIRSATAFGAKEVFLISCADPFSQKAVRSSMGCVFSIPVRLFDSTCDFFDFAKSKGIGVAAAILDKDSKDVRTLDFSRFNCVLIGNEGTGLSEFAKESADEKSIIPIDTAESLNAAIASSVFLWEMRRRK